MIRRPPRSTRTDTSFPTRRSSDLPRPVRDHTHLPMAGRLQPTARIVRPVEKPGSNGSGRPPRARSRTLGRLLRERPGIACQSAYLVAIRRSEEHTSELQSLMRLSYAVLCLKKKKPNIISLT